MTYTDDCIAVKGEYILVRGIKFSRDENRNLLFVYTLKMHQILAIISNTSMMMCHIKLR